MERFWNKVDKTSSCWVWTGCKREGYGRFRLNGKIRCAHRLSWEMHHKKEIPNGLCVCHTCDNPSCVNPDHLWLGTKKQNNKDKQSKGRSTKGRSYNCGSDSGSAKLTDQDVLTIRSLAGKVPQKELAQTFSVGQDQISRIINRKRWAHL
jgi:hypothetical protein